MAEHERPFLSSNELPPELAERLRAEGPYAAILWGTDHGTAYVIRAPGEDLSRLPRRTPVRVQHALWNQPTARLIRTVMPIHDQPDSTIVLKFFPNPADEQQRADFAAL